MIEAENRVLGTLLRHPELAPEVCGQLTLAHFTHSDNALVFRAILWHVNNKRDFNALKIMELLERRKKIRGAGGYARISELAFEWAGKASLGRHVKSLLDGREIAGRMEALKSELELLKKELAKGKK